MIALDSLLLFIFKNLNSKIKWKHKENKIVPHSVLFTADIFTQRLTQTIFINNYVFKYNLLF